MKTRTLVTVFAAAAALGLVRSAGATLIASESFDYPDGSALDDGAHNGGTGWTSPWGAQLTTNLVNGTVKVTSPGLTSPGLDSAGNAATVTPNSPPQTSGSTVVIREFAPTGSGISSGTLYASMLITKTNNGTRFLTANFRGDATGSPSTAQRGSFGSISGQTTWSFGVPGQPASSSGVPNTGTALLVERIDFNMVNGTGERIRLYVNPTPGQPEPATANADSLNTLPGVTFEMGNISAIDIGAGATNANGTTSTGTFDELRLGTTFADVTPVPEPAATAAAAGLSVLGLARRRRR